MLRFLTLSLSVLVCFSFLSAYLHDSYAFAENEMIFKNFATCSANAENKTALSEANSYDGFTPVSAQKGTLWADIALFICNGIGEFFSWPAY